MAGQFTRNWQVIGGVATMQASVLEGTTASNAAGSGTRWSPELTATLWTSYKASDKVSVGLRYTSEQKRLEDPNVSAAVTTLPEKIPASTVADVMVSCKVNNNVTMQLNVYNVFNKDYINALNNGGFAFFPRPAAFHTAQRQYRLQEINYFHSPGFTFGRDFGHCA